MQTSSSLPKLISGISSAFLCSGSRSIVTASKAALITPPPVDPGHKNFLAWLGNKDSGRISVPLTQPLPGTAASTPYTAPTVVPPTEVTVLSNGARIVSEASSVSGSEVLLLLSELSSDSKAELFFQTVSPAIHKVIRVCMTSISFYE